MLASALPVRGQRRARQQRRVLEGAVALVHPQLVRLAVVGDVDVDPAVAVEVGGRRRRAPARTRRPASALAVTSVNVPSRLLRYRRSRLRAGRRAEGSSPGSPVRREASLVRLDAVVHVVADVQIEPAIAVVVDERRQTRSNPGSSVPLCLRHVGERSVAVVAEHLVRSEVGEVEVDAAVVVDVARRHAHAVPARVDPARIGHVGEPQRARPVGADLQVVSVAADP